MQFWLQWKLNAGYAQPLWCISGMADGQESEVELGFQQYIYFATTGKKWLIPSPLIKDSGDHKWLQIVTANYGLCNLLTEGSVGKQPTLKGSKGLSELLGMRAQKMSSQFQANDLFEKDAESSKTAKRRKKASTVDGAESITLELPDFGSLLTRACKKKTEDLHIVYTAENVGVFCKWMYAKGADGDNDKRRAYTQTGKYAKSSKEDQED